MSDLFSDAFHEEREIVTFGKDIFEDRSEIHYKDFRDGFPSHRCNDVSFIKLEELDSNCRNILAVANTYICYSVKRNLLRLIDSLTGEKTILRGHETTIADIKVSPVDDTYFASVESSETAVTPHIFVWKRGSKAIDFTPLVNLPLRANLIRAHPKQSSVWAITDGKQLAVFSTEKIPTNPSYSSFSMFYDAESDFISNIAFTQDGQYLVGSITRSNTNQSQIQLWRISTRGPSVETTITGTEKLQAVYTQFSSQVHIENLLGLNTFGNYFITISSVNDYSFVNSVDEEDRTTSGILNYEVNIWKYLHSSTLELLSPPQLVQSIILHLPEYKSKLPFQSSSLKNRHLECSIVVEPKNQHYLAISSRKSRFAAILAINTNYLGTGVYGLAALSSTSTSTGDLGKVIYHVSLIDFTVPIVSKDVVNVVAREHHSSEEDEHVEISCYQENKGDPGSASIQQYHITVPSLYDQKKYFKNLENYSVNEIKGRTIFNLLNSVTTPTINTTISNSAAPSVIGTPSAAATSSSLKKTNSVDGSDTAPKSSTTPRVAQTVAVPAEAKTEQAVELIAPKTLTVDKESLTKLQQPKPVEGLKKLDSAALFAGKKGSVTPSSIAVSDTPPQVAATTSTSAPASAAKANNDLPDFFKRAPAQNVNILSMLNKAATPGTTAPATAANVATPVVKSSPAVAQTKKIDTAPKPTETLLPAAKAESSDEEDSESEEEKQEKLKATSISGFDKDINLTPSSSSQKSPFQPSDLNSIQGDALYSLLLEMKNEIKNLQTTTNTILSSQAETTKSLTDKLTSAATAAQAVNAAKASAAVNQPSAATSNELAKLKDDIVKELHVQQHKSMLHSTQLVKTHIDNENKKLAETFQQIKQETVHQIQETLTNKFLPILSTKVKEIIHESVKETIKIHLSDSFRNAFENSLLPAFQSGIDRLFAQVNVSFENGLKSLILETDAIQQQNLKSNEEVENEVKLLQDKIINLEAIIHELSQKLTGNILVTASSLENNNGKDEKNAPPPQTPSDLLKQGLVEEAVRLALEMKDVSVTVEVLAELTPAKVNSSCSNIVKLCITQQLAADMSVNLPAEGVGKRIDWIKNLLLSLIKIPKHEIENDQKLKKNFRIMIQAVLESIQATRNLVASAQYDNGEDDPIEIPPSVETDLQLLEFLIESKM